MTHRQAQSNSTRNRQSAFSLIELVIVVVIIGIIGAIAIPRMSSSAENAAASAVIADRVSLQRAADLYEVEHQGVMIHTGAASMAEFYFRFIQHTDLDGTVNEPAGIYGPYINTIPANRHNGLVKFRLDGPPAGANTHGWRYDTVSGLIEPDHTDGIRTFQSDAEAIDIDTGDIIVNFGG